MGDKQGKELDAFISFFGTFEHSHPVAAAADLSDGSVLYEILSTYFASVDTERIFVAMQSTFAPQPAPARKRPTTGSSNSALSNASTVS